jgi:hypothetical protein
MSSKFMKNATFRNKLLEYNKEQVGRAETTKYTTETSRTFLFHQAHRDSSSPITLTRLYWFYSGH